LLLLFSLSSKQNNLNK